MVKSIVVDEKTTERALSEIRAFLSTHPLVAVFRISGFYVPEIIPAQVWKVEREKASIWIWLQEDYNHSPLMLSYGTSLEFLQDRLVMRTPGGQRAIQFVVGRSLHEVEGEWRSYLPLTREEAERLRAHVAADLPPGVRATTVLMLSATGAMKERLDQQGKKECVLLTLDASTDSRADVFPLVQLDQWHMLKQYARPAPPERVFVPETCSEDQRDLIRQYSQMLWILQHSSPEERQLVALSLHKASRAVPPGSNAADEMVIARAALQLAAFALVGEFPIPEREKISQDEIVALLLDHVEAQARPLQKDGLLQ